MRYEFDQQLFRYLQNMERKFAARSMNLGGSANGGGGPPGGFIGFLPQNRVAFDIDEFESNIIPSGTAAPSGKSLITNLNRIRYRIAQLETGSGGSGNPVDVYKDDVMIVSGIQIINFEGSVDVFDDGGNKATVTILGSGGSGTDEKAKVSANDTTAGYLNGKLVTGTGITLTELNNGSNETLQIACTVVDLDEKAKVSANDTTAGYLNGKLVAGSGIVLTEINNGSNETLRLDVTVSGGGSSHNPVTLDAYSDAFLSINVQELGLDTQVANKVFAGPTTGVATIPTFRSVVAADLGTGTPTGAKYLRDDLSWQVTSGGGASHNAVTLDADAAIFLDLNDQELGLDTQSSNSFFAGPTTGVANEPTFRAIVAADLGTGTPTGVKFLRDDLSWQIPSGGGSTHSPVTLDVDAAIILDLTDQEIGLDNQAANTVLAGPTTGAANEPTFRVLVAADVGTGTPTGLKYLRDDMSWQAVTSSGGSGSGSLNNDFIHNIDGALAVASGIAAFIAPRVTTIQGVYLYGTTLGTSGSTIVDVHKNGTTIFTTQANRPTLAYNDPNRVAVSGTPTIIDLIAEDVLTLDIDQIAVSSAGLAVLVAMSTITVSGSSGGNVFGDPSGLNNHLAIFNADGYHLKDGGVVPSGGSGTGSTDIIMVQIFS